MWRNFAKSGHTDHHLRGRRRCPVSSFGIDLLTSIYFGPIKFQNKFRFNGRAAPKLFALTIFYNLIFGILIRSSICELSLWYLTFFITSEWINIESFVIVPCGQRACLVLWRPEFVGQVKIFSCKTRLKKIITKQKRVRVWPIHYKT